MCEDYLKTANALDPDRISAMEGHHLKTTDSRKLSFTARSNSRGDWRAEVLAKKFLCGEMGEWRNGGWEFGSLANVGKGAIWKKELEVNGRRRHDPPRGCDLG